MCMKKYVVGVDEAGRGPLAGPVAVGVACVPKDFDWKLLPGVGDSKKLSPKNREAIFHCARELRRAGAIEWSVAMVGAPLIDTRGIVWAVKTGISRGLKRMTPAPTACTVKLDGLLQAPEQYTDQETIIKGDQKEKIIGLASILAKVTRDRYMERLATCDDLVPYDFAAHKGYGTKTHRNAIKTHGISAIHRESYCRGLLR